MDMEQVNAADKLRNATTALEPDTRALTTVAIRADGTTSMVTLEEHHADVSQFEMTLAVPLDIRVHFETAKNLYCWRRLNIDHPCRLNIDQGWDAVC